MGLPQLRAQTNFFWTNALANPAHNWSQYGWTNAEKIASNAPPAVGGANYYSLNFLISANVTNNLAGAFQLNRLSLCGASGGGTVSLYGNDLVFVTNSSGGAPSLVMDFAGFARAGTIGNNVILSNNTVIGGNVSIPNGSLTLAGVVSGPGGILKTNVAILVLSSNNTYTGGTTVSNGTLQIGAGAASGWIQGDITSLGTVIFNRSDNVTFSNVLAGSGSLMKKGAGTLILTSNNTYSGGTVLSNGTLSISVEANLGAASSAFTFAGGTLQVTGTSVTNLGSHAVNWGNFSGGFDIAAAGNTFTVTNDLVSLGLLKVGAGRLVFNRTATLTGVTSVTGGEMAAVGGLLNRGLLVAVSNSTINVGGLNQASAMASLVTFTNDVGGTNFVGSPGASGILNASTNGIGYLNRGVIQTYAMAGHWSTGFINATVYNDVGGSIGPSVASSYNRYLTLFSVPTNAGTIQIMDGALTLAISQGDLVNQGVIRFGVDRGNFTLANGALINDTNGSVFLSATLNTPNLARSTWNRGTIVVSNYNNGSGYTANFGGGITNDGTFRLYAAPNAVVANDTLGASNLINRGTVMAIGYLDGLTNAFRLVRIGNGAASFPATPVTNQAGGIILATNGAALSINGAFRNDGTLIAHSNSTLGVGSVDTLASVTVGTIPFSNPGTISLQGGTFGASSLTNAGILQGFGSVGRSTLTNLTLGAASNMVRYFAANNPIINSGSILPGGTLNAGAISNLSGGLIAGAGTIQSISTTNYYDSGTNLVIQSSNTGAQVFNAANATILADGGTLVLGNGLSGNTQAGTIGTTNGGILLLGDGSLALTNFGTVRLQGGALQVGALVNSGSLVGTGAVQAATVTSSGTLAPGFSPGTLGFSNDLTLTGSSVLNLEIAGTNSTDYDRLLVGGAFTQGGTLNISFLSYTPTGGEVFDLFDFASLVGSFSTTNLPTLGGGLAWDFNQFQTQGILGITAPIPEPGTTTLLLLSAVGLFALRPRRRLP